ncbi:hypothetical protein GCM10009840_01330 [Pseudolysinimonas kribbensis]|uniref:Uncharacterized protein n=1 Tax=Pseudolysinimonas kribbensis TaxID=433641 RepID=A0ABQ6K1D3_9MICO|nr:DUF5819 family protein [Pseudolysinimonas kribbensis]GMA94407.1 hypothetical protein GCM10025881_12310 [Pseudolysinimonas kribbensis]
MTHTRGARFAAGAAVVLVGVYVATSLSFSDPGADPFKRVTTGLRSTASPYFTQSWNVFAPNILKTNIELEIAAQWRDGSGRLVKSGWFSATKLELADVAGQPSPSRAVKQSWNLIRAYNTRFLALDRDQQEVVLNTFIRRVGDDQYTERTDPQLTAQLNSLGHNPAAVRSLLQYDDVMVQYSTLLATAYFGRKAERVRWRIVYHRPNDFAHRASSARQFPAETRAFGWREADQKLDADSLAAFRDFVARSGGRHEH